MAREGEFTGTTQQEFVSCAAGLLENHGPGDLTVTFVYSTGEHERRELSPMQRFKWQPRDTEPALVEKVQVVPDASTTFYFAHSEYARGVPPAESFHRRIILQPRDASGSAVPLDIDIAAQTLNRVAIDIEAATIGNISVDIAAQSVGNLAMDIAAQSVGNLNVNIAAQSVANLNIDIAAQTIGNISIDIAAQALSQLDSRATSNTLYQIFTALDGSFEIDNTLTNPNFTAEVSGAGEVDFVSVRLTKVSGTVDSAEDDVQISFAADGEDFTAIYLDGFTKTPGEYATRYGTRADNPIGVWVALHDTTNQDFFLVWNLFGKRFSTSFKVTVEPLDNVNETLSARIVIGYRNAESVTEKEKDQGTASTTDTARTGGSKHVVPL